MSGMMILAASILRYHADKQTDRQTNAYEKITEINLNTNAHKVIFPIC